MNLLTDQERELLALTGQVADQFARVIGDGPSRDGDVTEAVFHVHALQNMILAQAAARAYPDEFRLLGGVVAASMEGDA